MPIRRPVLARPARLLGPAIVLLLLLLGAASPGRAAAQQGAAVTINITSAETGEPLAGAQVVVGGGRSGVIADAGGVARLTNLPAGELALEIRMLGFQARSFTLELPAGERLVIDAPLQLAPIALDGVEAVATPAPPRSSGLAATGFYERMERGGGGTFLTRDQIMAREPSLTSDVFRRLPGVRVVRYDAGYNNSFRIEMSRGAQTMRGGGECPVVYYVDGVQRQLSPQGIDEIRPEEIEAIEVYRGSGALPPQFRAGSSSCGVVAIWTRRR